MTPADALEGTTGPAGDEPDDLPEETVISTRTRPSDEVDESTAISTRRRPDGDLPDEVTVISTRRRPSEDLDEATEISTRRRPDGDLPDEATEISTRRRPSEDVDEATAISTRPRPDTEPDDVTAPSTRGTAAARASLPEGTDDTVVSRRTPPAGVDTVPEEDTVLRPKARASRQPSPPAPGEGVRPRDAHVPDAAILRAPAKPRAVPPVTAARAPVPVRPPAPGAPVAVPDHESVERAVRARARRRVLIVVLCAAAAAIAATTALVLLLT